MLQIERTVEENKKIIERYPFLKPKYSNGNEPPYYDYSWTYLDLIPNGWYKAFGKEMLEEIREDCIKNNYLDKLMIADIKEKYGELRIEIYVIPIESKIFDILNKYEKMSGHFCMFCGKPSEIRSRNGWLTTMCSKCEEEINKKRINRRTNNE